MTGAFDLLWLPLKAFSPSWALVIFSVLTGILMLLVFRVTSDQVNLKRAKNKAQAELIALRLYQNDLGVFLRTQLRILTGTVKYLRYSMTPILVLLIPLVLVFVQLNWRFGVRPLRPNEAGILKVIVSKPELLAGPGAVSLEAGSDVRIETAGVRIPKLEEIAWRIRPTRAGRHMVVVRANDHQVEKLIVVGDTGGLIAQRRTGAGDLESLLYPGESSIDPSIGIRSIQVGYPAVDVNLFGWQVHWLVLFMVVSIGAGFLLKGVFRVEF